MVPCDHRQGPAVIFHRLTRKLVKRAQVAWARFSLLVFWGGCKVFYSLPRKGP